MNLIRIGTRGSKLALWQASYVKKCLIDLIPDNEISIITIKTSGDTIQNQKLTNIGGKGLFVKEIEDALISEEIDIAVHSMKDVPSVLPAGLHIGAVLSREDARDVLISRNHMKLLDMDAGATIGTGSLRRNLQLKSLRNDIVIKDIRGNVDTRLNKLRKGDYDAIILASAGIKRLGLEDQITQAFSINEMIPSAGQGIVGIECRENDVQTNELLKRINNLESEISVKSERNFIKFLGGDCNLPVACHCEFLNEGEIRISGFISSIDGKNIIKDNLIGKTEDSQEISTNLASGILDLGGKEIVKTFR